MLGDGERERLMAAAAALCARRAYAEIDVEAIAARACLPATTMRRLFPGGTEECLAAAENTILREVVTAVSGSYQADRSEWESVVHGVKALLELMAGNPEFAYLGFVCSRQMAPGQVKEINEAGHRMLEAMLERGWEYSGTVHQPATAALGVLGGAQALVRRELVAGRADRLPSLLPDCVYIATVPFLGQCQALQLARRAREMVWRVTTG